MKLLYLCTYYSNDGSIVLNNFDFFEKLTSLHKLSTGTIAFIYNVLLTGSVYFTNAVLLNVLYPNATFI